MVHKKNSASTLHKLQNDFSAATLIRPLHKIILSISRINLRNTGEKQFFFFYLYIYPPDSQESDGGAIHRASNYPDLLPEMPRYCCPLII